ncbi:MAG: hypothetical protein US50_C0069G0003 [Candidatus Nomurabacteria bacterium GW2011_GWB1_37_5]|uniref:MHD domain-containing protein n=1 Tax=Candidatus Nomurabacteria bacterium GW2011_GWB1_37_5 TaxID=1618742 RepID=A0A0G0JB09_9BACT|nr:MAG: hypothetical protein US50_C0069G0003 [Candidatus Nomurabacteria bacterium GW2011_GWB1_37_5]
MVWGLSNTTNDVARAEVRAKLPPFSVKWLGKISPTSENVSYNDASKEVVWRVGNIPRGTGLNGNPREVSFQIELTPSIAQIGSVPPLLEESVLTGEDTFANVTLKSTRSKIDTRISSDPAYKGADEIVVQ